MIELAAVEKGYSMHLENALRQRRLQGIHDRAGSRKMEYLDQSLRWTRKSSDELWQDPELLPAWDGKRAKWEPVACWA